MAAVVYEILIGDKRQIGSTGRLERRMREHLNALLENRHCNKKMQNAFNKYNTFEYLVLSSHKTRKEAYDEEQVLIDRYYGLENYLMLNPKATAPPVSRGSNNPFSRQEVIKKCVETKKQRGLFIKTERTRCKISAANKGRKQSEEEKLKRKEILKAVRSTDIYKQVHKEGCLSAQKEKAVEAKLNSTRLFRENNPSYKMQTCNCCGRSIRGASAFKRFHGENCKLKN